MSRFRFAPYVPVAQRRQQAAATAKKMSKGGRVLSPVALAGTKIAETFWGRAWCDNLEAYSDFSNRLPRGRTYVRNGSVLDLQIAPGKVEALVQGSSLYKIGIEFSPLPPKRWTDFKRRSAGKIVNLLDLLQGRLSKELLADLTVPNTGLFPSPKEIKLGCSCPDWAEMCKHVAAVLYGVGARLDQQPELFFVLRGVDMQELITAASSTATGPLSQGVDYGGLSGDELSQIFGVELEVEASETPTTSKARLAPVPKRKPSTVRTTKPAADRVRLSRAGARASTGRTKPTAKTRNALPKRTSKPNRRPK
jgi:uncharacterized Zn finger protein